MKCSESLYPSNPIHFTLFSRHYPEFVWTTTETMRGGSLLNSCEKHRIPSSKLKMFGVYFWSIEATVEKDAWAPPDGFLFTGTTV